VKKEEHYGAGARGAKKRRRQREKGWNAHGRTDGRVTPLEQNAPEVINEICVGANFLRGAVLHGCRTMINGDIITATSNWISLLTSVHSIDLTEQQLFGP
jgi:hypothetical protein